MKQALIIIDLQNDFLSKDGILGEDNLLSKYPNLIKNIEEATKHFRSRNQPIIWIRSEYYEDISRPSKDHNPIPRPPGPRYEDAPMKNERLSGTHVGSRPFYRPNTPGAELHESVLAIKKDDDIVITKNYFSAFTETNLQETLRKQNIEGVILAGVTANTCVLATATDAFFLRYDVSVLENCVEAFSEEMKANALEKIRTHYGRVIHSVKEAESAIVNEANDLVRPVDAGTRALYWVNGSIPSWRVMIALAEKGIKYDRIRLKVMSHPKETRSAAFSRLNPRCKTPTLVDEDGTVVIESMAILQYLESTFDAKSFRKLLPDPKIDKGNYAKVISRFQESENIHYVFDDIELSFLDDATTDPAKKSRIIDAYENTLKELAFWEGYVQDGGFVGGTEFTVADCAFYPCIAYLERRGYDYDGFPALKAYVDRMKERSSVKDALPEGWEKRGNVNLWAKAKKLAERDEV